MSEDTQHGVQRLGGARDGRPLPPRALVLAGGGARAAYEVGVLSAITERAPGLTFPIVTGVSAGAINAMYLAAHQGSWVEAVRALRQRWSQLTSDRVFRLPLWPIARALVQGFAQAVFGGHRSAAAVRGLVDLDPLREFLCANIDFTGIDANIAAGRLRAAALSATSYASGETVTFVAGPPEVAVWRRALRHAVRCQLTADHVMASAALPILFPAVRIGDAFYGDGSVRQTAPLAPAIHLGARAILVVTQRSEAERTAAPAGRDYPAAAEVIGLLLHAIFLDALEADVERLERVNRLLARLSGGAGPAGTAASEGLRPVSLLLLRPSQNLGSLAAGSGATLPPMMRWVVRAMGGQRESAVDFLSYLLFDPAYLTALIELGYADALAQWSAIERFLASTAD
ncbi:MAG TPA: patatin-like phospholipase family protein [Gemmatimonadales bacterium]|jgi:NTE family protein|nr:patatin-like phospholipase family protein [Gemmatimonadales bacterium]